MLYLPVSNLAPSLPSLDWRAPPIVSQGREYLRYSHQLHDLSRNRHHHCCSSCCCCHRRKRCWLTHRLAESVCCPRKARRVIQIRSVLQFFTLFISTYYIIAYFIIYYNLYHFVAILTRTISNRKLPEPPGAPGAPPAALAPPDPPLEPPARPAPPKLRNLLKILLLKQRI